MAKIEEIEMPKCIDCGTSWTMTRKEFEYWKIQVEKNKYQMPKRCSACRRIKRNGEDPISVLLAVKASLNKLAQDLLDMEDMPEPTELSQKLTDMSAQVDKALRDPAKLKVEIYEPAKA